MLHLSRRCLIRIALVSHIALMSSIHASFLEHIFELENLLFDGNILPKIRNKSERLDYGLSICVVRPDVQQLSRQSGHVATSFWRQNVRTSLPDGVQ